MEVVNKTGWDTRALRSILTRVAREEFERTPERIKTLRVTIRYARSGSWWVSGSAYMGGRSSLLKVPRPGRCKRPEARDGTTIWREDFPARDFAITAAHEFGHNRGIPHRKMALHHRCNSAYAREHFVWADSVEVPVKKAPVKPTVEMKRAKALAAAQQNVLKYQRRVKLAQTLLKKWQRKTRELERRMAASPARDRGEVTGHAGSDGMASEVSQ